MGTSEGPPARRGNGGRRRRWTDVDDDDDDEDYVAEEEEDDFAEELAASSAGEEGEDSDAEYQEDEEEEEEEEETPRPAKGGRKGKMDPATARAKRRKYEVDDDYEEEPSEDEEPNEEDEVEEYHEETPRPVKGNTRGHKGRIDPATVRARRRRYEEDDDYEEPDKDEEEPDEEDEVDEYDEETPRPVKSGARGHKGKMDPATAKARQRRYEVDDDYEEPDEDEEQPDIDEEYREEIEEEEEAPPHPKSAAKCIRRCQNVEAARSHRRNYEDDDMDFEPELDDVEEEEEEVDEDIDFDPELDDEDEDEEEEDFGATRARKVTIKNPAKLKSVPKRRSLKKKTVNKGSKASKRRIGSAKAKKSAPVRRVRKRFVVDDSDEDLEDDDDFIVDDQVEVNRHSRKKARTGTSKRTVLECPSVFEEESWPNVESETSEFEFVTSDDDEPDDAGTAVVEDCTVRKGRKKRKSGFESSSDSEFVVSDKELLNLGETEPLKLPPVLPTQVPKNSNTRHGEEKGKEKQELEEAGKPICGICLSEEQRATVQGVLNCCSHYFCFACIMEWSRVESRCPLCKQRFTTITKSSKEDLGLGLRKAIIRVEERDQVYQPTEEEIRRWLDPYENVVCIECNQGGDDSLMLLCDICDSSAHTYCVGLGREVPEGNWYCGGCRLSDEGPSHARTPHTVGYERQSYRNHVDFSSVGFGVAAQNGTYDRSSSTNRRRSFRGIDLNLSPREVPGEIHPAESQASTDNVSTPGRSATVSGRRQIHRYIRILLSRPRPITTRIEDMLPSFVPRNGAVPRTELNHRSFRSSEANTSQIPDAIQNQHNVLHFAPYMSRDGDDFQHIEGVKSNLKNV